MRLWQTFAIDRHFGASVDRSHYRSLPSSVLPFSCDRRRLTGDSCRLMDNSFVICQCRDKFSHGRASSHSSRPVASRETPVYLVATLALHFQICRFANPVLSSNCELLFSQLLSFHNHLRCPLFFRFHYPLDSRLSRKSFVCRFAVRFGSNSFICRICAFRPGWQESLLFLRAPIHEPHSSGCRLVPRVP